ASKTLLRKEAGQRRRRFTLPRAQTPHLAVAPETQAGSQLQGSKAPQAPLHFSDTSPELVPGERGNLQWRRGRSQQQNPCSYQTILRLSHLTTPWKLPCIITWDGSRNQNLPTDSAEEADSHDNRP